MKFALLYNEPAESFGRRADPAHADAYWGAWMAYMKAMREAGVMQDGAGLQPPEEGVRVRIRDGARDVQDGPYADAKEQLGGFVVIETATAEEAHVWAAKAPCATEGYVEVRPLMRRSEDAPDAGAEQSAAG